MWGREQGPRHGTEITKKTDVSRLMCQLSKDHRTKIAAGSPEKNHQNKKNIFQTKHRSRLARIPDPGAAIVTRTLGWCPEHRAAAARGTSGRTRGPTQTPVLPSGRQPPHTLLPSGVWRRRSGRSAAISLTMSVLNEDCAEGS